MRTNRTTSHFLAGLIALGMGLGLAGCIGYTTYPAASWQVASNEMNGPPADEIMIASIKWAMNRYEEGSGGSVAVNLPDVVRDRTYSVIVSRSGDRAVPMEPGLEDLPTYHLVRLWVRGEKAEVDLLRPVTDLGASPTGEQIVQAVTLYLEGGLHRWRVERARHWSIGTDAVPALHYLGVETPETDSGSESGSEPMIELES